MRSKWRQTWTCQSFVICIRNIVMNVCKAKELDLGGINLEYKYVVKENRVLVR